MATAQTHHHSPSPRPEGTRVPSRRPGRPTSDQSTAITATIIESARVLFLREGYSATSMEAIAARAGISKGTLYTRFPRKELLFAALVENRVKAWAARAQAHRAPADGSLRERLRHHLEIMLDCIVDPEVATFGRLLSSERERFPELERIYREHALTRSIDPLIDDIERGAQACGHRTRDAREVAFALMEAAWGWANVRLSGEDPHDADACVRAAQRIADRFVGGIASW
jgi:TetR/AcrR family transcriptional regulator, mexJK operon transcriptional repressor